MADPVQGALGRKSIGVCSQQDVLFDLLTVREHVELWAELCGVALLPHAVRDMLADVDLVDKVRHA